MDNAEVKQLCIDLMKADSEESVISVLTNAGYWNDDSKWRYYGDNENNWGTTGTQQSRPDAALVEKLVNSVDARLMNECYERGDEPEGPDAPQTITEAVARYFENGSSTSDLAGRISEWSDPKRNEVAQGITLSATGYGPQQGNPCFSIADCGEGQTPDRMPETLLSLSKSNKLRIPFVQGKFNMGGSGVLRFCGKHNLQFILTKRNPKAIKGKDSGPDSDKWGFTIVRREDPKGGVRSSVYTYLAPLESEDNPRRGKVLRFSSGTMPIFPKGNQAYVRESQHGTLIKLYEYVKKRGYSNSHILLRGGIQARMDLLLPHLALPIRLHECRKSYKGHAGSFDNNVNGLTVRLHDDAAQNIEAEWPAGLNVDGEKMIATIYVFRKGKASTYKRNEGIIFTLNGQTHGQFTQDFFIRAKVKHSYLRDSILVIVDCSEISGRAREDLFMNSRDRISGGELSSKLESALEDLLRNHKGLKELADKRRRDEAASKLKEDKPLEDILTNLLKMSPTLSALFLSGQRIVNPVKTEQVASEEKEYLGERFPTFFKFKDVVYGEELRRNCPINRRARITFETDAENSYFGRKTEKGIFSLYRCLSGEKVPAENYIEPNLHNGRATLSIEMPAEIGIGETLRYTTEVIDPSRVEPFENSFEITITEAVINVSSGGSRVPPPAEKKGKEHEKPAGIALPNIERVREEDWANQEPPFDKFTGLRIRSTDVLGPEGEESDQSTYDFKVNIDNIYLKTELKNVKTGVDLIRARFLYGMVLVGLALLQDEERTKKKTEESDDESVAGINIEDKVEQVTRAVAPILLPMINSLGSLEMEEDLVDATGEEF